MDHVRGGPGGPLAVVATLHQGHVHTLQGEVAERANPVDAATNDQHAGAPTLFQSLHLGAHRRVHIL